MSSNLRSKKILISIFLVFSSFFIINAKSKKEKTVIKYIHPRIYEFDLCDTENQVFLSYNPNIKLFDVYIDFSKYVQQDLPQAGDKVIFYYKGYSTKDGGSVKATVTGDNNQRITDEEKYFAKNLQKKVPFESSVSFILNKDVKSTIQLYLCSTKQNKPGKVDQFFLNFKRLKETTDTSKESANQKAAEEKNIEIIEVTTEITKDEDINALIADTPNISDKENILMLEQAKNQINKENQQKIEQEKLEQERLEKERLARIEEEKKKIEEQKRLEQEKIIAQKEEEDRKKDQMDLEKALELVKNKKSSGYQKEFLHDYMIFDEPEVEQTNKDKSIILENPDETDSFGKTLLMKAAKAGNDWQISALLASGANVNLKDKDGWTALMYAVRYQESLNCVDLLLQAQADVKIKNKYGSSALMIASCYNNNPQIIKKLLSYYQMNDKEVLKSLVLLLSESQTSEYTSIAKLNAFLDYSVPLNTFYEGKTPLMYACEFGNSTKIIKVLIDNNAITSIRSTEGKTAYDYASENQSLTHDSNYWLLNKK